MFTCMRESFIAPPRITVSYIDTLGEGRAGEREIGCVCVCVREREREREHERAGESERETLGRLPSAQAIFTCLRESGIDTLGEGREGEREIKREREREKTRRREEEREKESVRERVRDRERGR